VVALACEEQLREKNRNRITSGSISSGGYPNLRVGFISTPLW